MKFDKESFRKEVEKRDDLRTKVDELVARNAIIGQEATLKDVLLLFKEFNISDNIGFGGYSARTRIINRVLGGEVMK